MYCSAFSIGVIRIGIFKQAHGFTGMFCHVCDTMHRTVKVVHAGY